MPCTNTTGRTPGATRTQQAEESCADASAQVQQCKQPGAQA
jgi:hypothetical protein